MRLPRLIGAEGVIATASAGPLSGVEPVAQAQVLLAASLPASSAEAEIASPVYAASATQEAAQSSTDARSGELKREIEAIRSETERLQASGAHRAG